MVTGSTFKEVSIVLGLGLIHLFIFQQQLDMYKIKFYLSTRLDPLYALPIPAKMWIGMLVHS